MTITEPLLAGIPLSLMFLYFVWYSFLGWAMETAYCSIAAHHFVERGFLYGPVCPIYGAGALLMVTVLSRFTGNIPLFLAASTVTMSAWEYLVGWVLETTTHIKYWDYSKQKFNLHGRICLKNSLYWGLVSYVAIYGIHPQTVRLFAHLHALPRLVLAGVLALVMLADTTVTIRNLALMTRFLSKAEEARLELEAKQKELLLTGQQKLEEAGLQAARQGLEAKQKLEEAGLQAALLRLELKHTNLLEDAAHYSRHFRKAYDHMSSILYRNPIEVLQHSSRQLLAHRRTRMAELKAKRRAAGK